MLKCKVFDRVREELPNFHEKIKPISAEFTKPNLAISSEDMEEMLSEVNVIFHCAATVRFDEPLKDALLLNVMGTQQLLRLAHQMKNLEALIHVSTAYSNSLTEYLIQQEKGDLNVAIIRPSIVGASWQEPFPSGKGILQTVKCNPAALADIIPVDLAINLTIAAGWYTAMHRNTFEKNPLEKPFRIPNITITSNYLVHQYWTFVHHTIPAFLCDLHLRLIGKKPRHSWDWSSENANMLMKELNPKDKNVSIFIEALHPHGYLKCAKDHSLCTEGHPICDHLVYIHCKIQSGSKFMVFFIKSLLQVF
ncbi:putative Fatty acyl-CoA reductase protein [Naja naja]|nr:putative Fatty acyl-CoA reductase protein [Naja naja]